MNYKTLKNYEINTLLNKKIYSFLISKIIEDKGLIIDIGADLGLTTNFLMKKKPYFSVFASDIKNNLLNKKTPFILLDLTKINYFNHQFNYVFCIEVFEHIDKIHEEEIFNNLKNLLHPQGTIFLSTPIKKYWNILKKKTNDHVNEVESDYMEKKLKKHFNIKEKFVVRREDKTYYTNYLDKKISFYNIIKYNWKNIITKKAYIYNLISKKRAFNLLGKKIRIIKDEEMIGKIQIYVLTNKKVDKINKR